MNNRSLLRRFASYSFVLFLCAGLGTLLLGCRKTLQQDKAPVSSETSFSIDSATAAAEYSSQPEIQIFHRTAERRRTRILGAENPVIYSSPSAKLLCYQYYYVVQSQNSQLRVFRRSSPSLSDTITVSSEDSVLVEYYEQGQSFQGLKRHYFFTDFGTSANAHGITVTDLSTGLNILDNVGYLTPIQIDSTNVIVYFEIYGPASRDNCPDYDKIILNSDPYIAKRVSFDLRTKIKKYLGKEFCFGLQ